MASMDTGPGPRLTMPTACLPAASPRTSHTTGWAWRDPAVDRIRRGRVAGCRQAEEFDALAGLAQTGQITCRGRAVSQLGRSADEFGAFRLERLLFPSKPQNTGGFGVRRQSEASPAVWLKTARRTTVEFGQLGWPSAKAVSRSA